VDASNPPDPLVPPAACDGIVRPAKRPAGWVAPGPAPRIPADRPEIWPRAGEDLCFLAGDWRILQRVHGHRWSLDDLLTAWWAGRRLAAPPAHAVDLGCGIGTVLLLLAWRYPAARVTGLEAQAMSVDLARRSIAFNGVEDRCVVRAGDFRDAASRAGLAPADLVTGTPPYRLPGTGTESELPQRAPCRFEHRGGVEEYVAAAAELLADGAPFVACALAAQRERVAAAARAAGLAVESWREVVSREGKPPLLGLYALRRGAVACAPSEPPLVTRRPDGRWTPEFAAVRREMGLPA
jgi:tRNA1Val (adenine37-N6)-methyltransferase